MHGHSEQIAEALIRASDSVIAQLVVEGWQWRTLNAHSWTTLTLPRPNGVLSVVEIGRTQFRWPDNWPVEVTVRLGIGYEPAMNLMPLFTLHPRAILIDDAEHGGSEGLAFSLDGPDSVAAVARQILRFIGDHSGTQAVCFPDAAAIAEHFHSAISRPASTGDEGDRPPSSYDAQRLLVLLAAMGRQDEARSLLAIYPPGAGESARGVDPLALRDRRFVRQLTRWLDADGPVAPPLEETVARLPQRQRPSWPSWADSRSKTNASKAALKAVRRQAAGKNRDQLIELIAREWNARGLEISRVKIEFTADYLQIERLPFGRGLSTLKAARMLISSGRDVVHGIRNRSAEKPVWLRLPDRASYPMIEAGGDGYATVELDADAAVLLDRVRAEAAVRIGPFMHIEVWLSRDGTAGPLTVHIGDRCVGWIRDEDAVQFDRVMSAAAMFDEDPFVNALFFPGHRSRRELLEVPLPAQ